MKITVITTLLGLLVSLPLQAQLLNDETNLKILKTRSQLLLLNAETIEREAGLNDIDSIVGRVDCGSIDIGNQDLSTTLTGDINIVITGDIINTGNRCTAIPSIAE
ncbi:MAG: hypothetical protein AAF197_06225 [Pseudomonadota bacterium]